MWSGWGVHVNSVTLAGDKSSQTYYAHVSDRAAAVEAVRKHIGAASSEMIEARKPLQSTVFAAMNIRIGEVGE
jgi:hypothetical protein